MSFLVPHPLPNISHINQIKYPILSKLGCGNVYIKLRSRATMAHTDPLCLPKASSIVLGLSKVRLVMPLIPSFYSDIVTRSLTSSSPLESPTDCSMAELHILSCSCFRKDYVRKKHGFHFLRVYFLSQNSYVQRGR